MRITYFPLDRDYNESNPDELEMTFKEFDKWYLDIRKRQAMNQTNPPVTLVHINPTKSAWQKHFAITDLPHNETLFALIHNSSSYVARVLNKMQRDIGEIFIAEYDSYEDAYKNQLDYMETSKFCYPK